MGNEDKKGITFLEVGYKKQIFIFSAMVTIFFLFVPWISRNEFNWIDYCKIYTLLILTVFLPFWKLVVVVYPKATEQLSFYLFFIIHGIAQACGFIACILGLFLVLIYIPLAPPDKLWPPETILILTGSASFFAAYTILIAPWRKVTNGLLIDLKDNQVYPQGEWIKINPFTNYKLYHIPEGKFPLIVRSPVWIGERKLQLSAKVKVKIITKPPFPKKLDVSFFLETLEIMLIENIFSSHRPEDIIKTLGGDPKGTALFSIKAPEEVTALWNGKIKKISFE